MESPVARSQHRPAVAGESRCDAYTGRPDVPRVERAKALHNSAGFVSVDVTNGKVLADRPGVVESEAGIDRDLFRNGQRLTDERAGREEPAANRRRIARDGLKRFAVVVDKSDAARNRRERVVLAFLCLSAKLPLVVRAEERRAIVRQ